MQGGAALVAVAIPVLAFDIFLGADSLDICQGFVQEGVHGLARPLCHLLTLHHLVTLGGAAVGGTSRILVLLLKFLG